MDGKHTKHPIFIGDNYSWWKNRMEHYVKSTDYECWLIIQKGPLAITVTSANGTSAPKSEDKYVEADYRKVEKNSKAMSILQYGIGEQEVNRISGCTSAKEIWDTLNLAYEGTSQVKKHQILNPRIWSVKSFKFNETWQPKVTAIEEAKDLSTLTLNELMGSLMAHELTLMKRFGESSKVRGLAFKSTSINEEDDGNDEFAMFTRNIVDIVNGHNPKRFNNNSSKKHFSKKRSTSIVGCIKCDEKGHQMNECPKWGNIKSKEKCDLAKKEYKNKVMCAVWGMSDSDEDEILEEELDAKLCLTTRLNNDALRSPKRETFKCLMAHPDDSDSNFEDEVNNLKTKVRSFSKSKVCLLLNKCRVQNNKLEAMQIEIENIAEENVGLRECLNELDNISPCLEKEVKKLKRQNLILVNKVKSLNVIETPFVTYDL
ncbi:uncharacterized protein LOC141641376 [Silene latifolia]|uniref:uncharacterized protein LOC141641376 n=1 Tax=Silene latifolia TaxID=37657 RepID=UPI003D77CBB1